VDLHSDERGELWCTASRARGPCAATKKGGGRAARLALSAHGGGHQRSLRLALGHMAPGDVAATASRAGAAALSACGPLMLRAGPSVEAAMALHWDISTLLGPEAVVANGSKRR